LILIVWCRYLIQKNIGMEIHYFILNYKLFLLLGTGRFGRLL